MRQRGAASTPYAQALLRGVLLLTLALAPAACSDQDDDAVHGSVHGNVRDAMTGKRLKGVDVVFVADTLEEAEDTTDGEGEFAINVSAATANGRLTASKSGYETRTVSVFLDDGDVTVDIEIESE